MTRAAASRSTSSRGPGCPVSRWSSPSCTRAASSAAGSYNATGGLHGVGASVVNALSSRLDVEVDRNGVDLRDVVPPRRARASSTDRGRRAKFTPAGRLRKSRPGREGRHRHPGQLLAGPADLPARGQLSLKELQDRARQTSFLVPGLALHGRSTPGPTRSPRRPSGTTAGSQSSASSWRRTRRSPTWSGCAGRSRFTETVPMLDDAGHMDADRRRARPGRRHRGALGHRLRDRASSPTSTSSPRPRAAPTWPASSGR